MTHDVTWSLNPTIIIVQHPTIKSWQTNNQSPQTESVTMFLSTISTLQAAIAKKDLLLIQIYPFIIWICRKYWLHESCVCCSKKWRCMSQVRCTTWFILHLHLHQSSSHNFSHSQIQHHQHRRHIPMGTYTYTLHTAVEMLRCSTQHFIGQQEVVGGAIFHTAVSKEDWL